jgi:SAM-dependent methyltransferase
MRRSGGPTAPGEDPAGRGADPGNRNPSNPGNPGNPAIPGLPRDLQDPSHTGNASDPSDPYDLEAGTHEHYIDAALYDFEYRRRRADINHYRALAHRFAGGAGEISPSPSPVRIIELGCGTGRLLVPLARDGHDVLGIDVAPTMLARAAERIARLPRRARGRARLLRADMRSLPLASTLRVPLIVCPFNAFQHLYTQVDVAACLAEVRAHLPPTGRFAFDVLQPDLRWLTRSPEKRWARTRFKHPVTGVELEYTTNQTYEPISQIAHIRIYYERLDSPDGDRHLQVVRLAHRQFFPAELEALLWSNGFAIETRWGGFSGEPLEGHSESQVLLCTPR